MNASLIVIGGSCKKRGVALYQEYAFESTLLRQVNDDSGTVKTASDNDGILSHIGARVVETSIRMPRSILSPRCLLCEILGSAI